MRRLKVYGQEREVPEEVFVRYAQQGAAFAQQREELAQERQKYEAERKAWEEQVKANTAEALRARGLDPKKWAAEEVVREYERTQETPEQKELREAREKLATFEKEKQEATQKAEQAKAEAVRTQHREEIAGRFMAALTELGVPEGPAGWPLVAEMARLQEQLDEAVLSGRVTPEEAAAEAPPAVLAKMALEAVRSQHALTFGNLRGEQLGWAMGDEWLDRAAEAWVIREEKKRAQAGAGAVPAGVQRPAPQPNGNGAARDPSTGQFKSRERSVFEEITGIRR